MAKEPITPLRLSARYRSFLERISDLTGHSMTSVVEHLLAGAIAHHERWPLKMTRRTPARGAAWRAARMTGKAFLSADLE